MIGVSTSRPKVILVLGMHRSGTSAAARLLNLLGAELGHELVTPGPDNPDGFWENATAVEINEDLLHALGRTWYDMREMPKAWTGQKIAEKAREQIQQLIEREFKGKPLVALKDPRMCLTAPLWIKAFEEAGFEVTCLFVIRDPREVVESLRVRNQWAREPLFLMWVQYIMEAASATREHKRLLITFDQLLSDWRATMRRVGYALDTVWMRSLEQAAVDIDSFLNKGRRNHDVAKADADSGDEAYLPGFAADLYDSCLRLANGQNVWSELDKLEVAYRHIADLYAAHVDNLLTLRWEAEGRAQHLQAKLDDEEDAKRVNKGLVDEKISTIDEVISLKLDDLARRIEILDRSMLSAAVDAEESSKRFDLMEEAFERRLAELQSTLREKEEVLIEKDVALNEKDAAIQNYIGQVFSKDSQLRALTESTSWRITAPLRWIRKTVSPSRWKQKAGYLLRWAYDKLPLSTQHRLALKRRVFKLVAPLIKNTRSYSAWQAFEAHRGNGSPLTRHPALPANGAAAQVLGEMYRLAGGRIDTDYVAMDAEPVNPSALDVRAIAFYLPQFHPIPENDQWWGRGFTEWTNVSKAIPQYVGHYQPHLPEELGFYDLRVVDVMRRQVELAKHYGLQGFCFHYYWFAGKRLLEKPLEQWLANKDIDFPFCVCWANENWTRRWDGLDQEMLIAQNYSPEDDRAFIAALEPAMRDSRYIRVDGRPLIVLYRPSILPDAAATITRWREYCREVGIGEIFAAMVQFDVEDPREYGFDAAIEFPPHKLARGLSPINEKLQFVNPNYAGYVVDYGAIVEQARNHKRVDYPMIRGVFPSWDNEARKPGRGYTFANATPRRYREWLSMAVSYARANPVAGERLVFINAWNEWAEGAHLEPDRRYGYAFLKQTRAALTETVTSSQALPRVAIVSHDAHPHGAQYLALNLARELIQRMGVEVELLLLGGGTLEQEFADVAPVHKLYGATADVAAVARDLSERGFDLVIANTAVSGRAIGVLHEAGMRVVSLVHELPGVIRQYGLESAVQEMSLHAERIVVPADIVGEGLKQFEPSPVLRAKLLTRPQGMFVRSRYRGAQDRSAVRAALRAKLSLPVDAFVVLAVGYADRRKGVDLLAQTAVRCVASEPRLHVVWVGHHDERAVADARQTLIGAGFEGHFHFVGLDFDTDDYYAGADVYALTSREDPFPSVVLESLSVGTPVVAFAGTGGAAELISKGGCGVVVPAFDVDAYAHALLRIVRDGSYRAELGRSGMLHVDRDFSFRSYVLDLMALGTRPIPRVSVIVPNYNYARYMRERLMSIVNQRLPVYEIIVLDDASTDNSLETLQALRAEIHPEPFIVTSSHNSGSVFRQWLHGVELARGEYVWIAEADDLAKPDFLERLVWRMEANPRVVLGYTQSEQINEAGNVTAGNYLEYTDDLNVAHWSESRISDGQTEVSLGLAIKNTLPNVSGVLFRTEPLREVLSRHIEEIASYRIAGDWLVYLLMLRNGQLVYDATPSNQHRRHGNSVTLSSEAEAHYQEVVRVQQAAEVLFELDDATRQSARRYARKLRSHLGLPDTHMAAN